ncbi:MAG: hypothetical protein N0E59_02160 [Candidatus Thiodiazotropha taylori]|nr:hypothetical protein [Candidatus Thiodiazotropha taylori]MCG8051910.1 hypothetical protein [Candidatus Thiodiazotropha taylori]MCG8108682.1 hypothetical protein [Candidatus Thiodiazotropha taylori]MCG8109546.1 hypothetical protein [Candidatus Thiodiazotropha taylori]MCW4281018.1 hypothetical protein [Candidatus Thiodiazotropha taylori]
MSDLGSKSKVFRKARKRFEGVMSQEADNRRNAVEDLRFARLGKQWDEGSLRQREYQGRPSLTFNRLNTLIRKVVNECRLNKPQIKVHPVDEGGDIETAKIYEGIINTIEYTSDADVAYSTAIELAVSSGVGYWTVSIVDGLNGASDPQIKLNRVIDTQSILGDPHAKAMDSSDWNYAFELEPVPLDRFKARYPRATPKSWDDDTHRVLNPQSEEDDTVMVCHYWTRTPRAGAVFELSDGQLIDEETFERNQAVFELQGNPVVNVREVTRHEVNRATLSGLGVLETQRWPGEHIPIVPVYGDEFFVEGRRYYRSLIRDSHDAQRMLNYWSTSSTELMAMAPKSPYIGPRGFARSQQRKWETAHKQPYAYLEYDGEIPPQRIPFQAPATGAQQEFLNASEHLKTTTGLFDASLGNRTNETSGRAIQMRQKEGEVGTGHFMNNLMIAIRHTGRIFIDLIPKVMRHRQMVRVMGPEGENQAMVRLGSGFMAEPGEPPEAKTPARLYDLNRGRYDLLVTSGQGFSSAREQSAYELMEFMKIVPESGPLLAGILARYSNWPYRDEINERMELMAQSVQAGINPERMGELQGQLEQAQKKIAELTRDSADNKLVVDIFKAMVDLMEVEGGLNEEQTSLGTIGWAILGQFIKEAEVDGVMEPDLAG